MSSSSGWHRESQLVATESEIENLKLLEEFGKQAWDEDLWVYSEVLKQLREKHKSLEEQLANIETSIKISEQKFDKELLVAEKDLFNYIRNNKRVVGQIQEMETKAKDLYNDICELGMNTLEIEKLASSLL
jgi:hypothetical protein